MKKLILAIFLLALITTSAYSPETGAEVDDVIIVDYKMTKENGDLVDQASNAQFTLSYNKLVEGFVDGVLGMKINEKKEFTIPPERGYTTGELAGIALNVEVTLLDVVGYTAPSSGESSNTPTLPVGNNGIILISFLGIIILPLLRRKR